MSCHQENNSKNNPPPCALTLPSSTLITPQAALQTKANLRSFLLRRGETGDPWIPKPREGRDG